MCYDISYKIELESIEDYFGNIIFDDPQIDLEFGSIDHIQGVAIFPKHPIIYQPQDDDALHCKMMEWGIIRFFDKVEPALVNRNLNLNIRSERVLGDTGSYWHKIRNRRCLIPLTGIYEHRAVKGWKKKVPYLIRPKGEGLFCLPGLYSVAQIVDKSTGEIIKRWTFGMITRAANDVMRNIHNDGENRHRMPLFITKEMALAYVRNDLTEDAYKEILNYEIPSEDLGYCPVHTIRTPKLRPDGKDKTEYFEWEKLPALGEMNPD